MTRRFKRKPQGSAGAKFKIEFGFCLRISPISYRGYSIDLLALEIARTVETEFNCKNYSLWLKCIEFIHLTDDVSVSQEDRAFVSCLKS